MVKRATEFCRYCGAAIFYNGTLWVEREGVFPQYCHDNFQNVLKGQKHSPAKKEG